MLELLAQSFFISNILISFSSIILNKILSSKFILPLLLGKFDHLYRGVFARHQNVISIKENLDHGFAEAFLKSINLIYEAVGPGGSICFCVDDLIFIDDINIRYYGTNQNQLPAFKPPCWYLIDCRLIICIPPLVC